MPDHDFSQAVQSLFESAQRGEQQPLDQFLTHVRPQILATCYRLLGNVDDAEDAAQEALIAILAGIDPAAHIWRALVFGSAVEAGLLAIAERTENRAGAENPGNTEAQARQAEPLLTGHMSLQEIDALEDFSGRAISTRESLTLVFINLLQLLPPEARAAYVLADILGCTAETATRAAHLRAPQFQEHLAFARRVMGAARAKLPTQAMLPSHALAKKILHRLGKGLIEQNAMRAVALFDLDAVLVIPGIGSFTGHEAIAAQLLRMFMVGLAPQAASIIEINGQPALVCFQKKEERRRMRYFANLVMAVTISEHAPQANKIVRIDVVTESKLVKKIGEAARRVKPGRPRA